MNKNPGLMHRTGRVAVLAVTGLFHLWVLLALYFWFSAHWVTATAAALGYAGLLVLIHRVAGSRRHAVLAGWVLAAAVTLWWARRQPETGLVYPRETEQAARFETDGDFLTVHGLRDFRYRSITDYDARWSTRTYDLNELEHVDLFFNNWGVRNVDHVITSFVFRTQPPLAASIELRAEADEPHTLARGFFKQYELFYVWGDERDLVRLRTGFRKEEVSLYRTVLGRQQARRLLLDMAARTKELEERPEFYNTLTDNCTNVIARHVNRVAENTLPWHRRPLLTGKYARLGYEHGWWRRDPPEGTAGGASWEELRQSARINDLAEAAGDSSDFSRLIRARLPGGPLPGSPAEPAGDVIFEERENGPGPAVPPPSAGPEPLPE